MTSGVPPLFSFPHPLLFPASGMNVKRHRECLLKPTFPLFSLPLLFCCPSEGRGARRLRYRGSSPSFFPDPFFLFFFKSLQAQVVAGVSLPTLKDASTKSLRVPSPLHPPPRRAQSSRFLSPVFFPPPLAPPGRRCHRSPRSLRGVWSFFSQPAPPLSLFALVRAETSGGCSSTGFFLPPPLYFFLSPSFFPSRPAGDGTQLSLALPFFFSFAQRRAVDRTEVRTHQFFFLDFFPQCGAASRKTRRRHLLFFSPPSSTLSVSVPEGVRAEDLFSF